MFIVFGKSWFALPEVFLILPLRQTPIWKEES